MKGFSKKKNNPGRPNLEEMEGRELNLKRIEEMNLENKCVSEK